MSSINIIEIELLAQQLVDMADLAGVVVTISLHPRQPLAMGNYKMVADVRPARVMADPLNREGIK